MTKASKYQILYRIEKDETYPDNDYYSADSGDEHATLGAVTDADPGHDGWESSLITLRYIIEVWVHRIYAAMIL